MAELKIQPNGKIKHIGFIPKNIMGAQLLNNFAHDSDAGYNNSFYQATLGFRGS